MAHTSKAIKFGNALVFYGFWALLVYMPFHIFLSQWLSQITGGLDAWKIAKDVVLALLVLFTICLVGWQRQGTGAFWGLTIAATVYAALHGVVWLAHEDLYTTSGLLGTIYNNRLFGFVLLGYGAALLHPFRFAFSSVMKGVLGVSTLVAFLGVLQYFLPSDLLTHFGYSLDRGARPVFFIDDHPDLPRIMSTLREPNALGAYLLVPIAALLVLLRAAWRDNRRYLVLGALGLHVLALILTQSRSAWLAFGLTVLLVTWWQYRQLALQILRRWWPVAVIGVVLAAGVGWAQRDHPLVQQYVIHSNPEESVADLDSNDYHWLLVREGLEGIRDEPLGHGPGTAGLASIQNPDGGQLTENYYVQIGYELGLAGLVLFVVLNGWIYMRLRARGDRFALVLCASFWGYVVTNMLLHTWSNEAVAAQWWLLAGIGLAAAAQQPVPQRAQRP